MLMELYLGLGLLLKEPQRIGSISAMQGVFFYKKRLYEAFLPVFSFSLSSEVGISSVVRRS